VPHDPLRYVNSTVLNLKLIYVMFKNSVSLTENSTRLYINTSQLKLYKATVTTYSLDKMQNFILKQVMHILNSML
jgi:hypothetical protein